MRQRPTPFSTSKMRILKLIALTAVLTAVSHSQVKTPPTPEARAPFAESLQVVVVTTDGWDASKGKGRLFERSSRKAKWKANGKEFDVVIGRNGSAWGIESAPESGNNFKKEGDGRSPPAYFSQVWLDLVPTGSIEFHTLRSRKY